MPRPVPTTIVCYSPTPMKIRKKKKKKIEITAETMDETVTEANTDINVVAGVSTVNNEMTKSKKKRKRRKKSKKAIEVEATMEAGVTTVAETKTKMKVDEGKITAKVDETEAVVETKEENEDKGTKKTDEETKSTTKETAEGITTTRTEINIELETKTTTKEEDDYKGTKKTETSIDIETKTAPIESIEGNGMQKSEIKPEVDEDKGTKKTDDDKGTKSETHTDVKTTTKEVDKDEITTSKKVDENDEKTFQDYTQASFIAFENSLINTVKSQAEDNALMAKLKMNRKLKTNKLLSKVKNRNLERRLMKSSQNVSACKAKLDSSLVSELKLNLPVILESNAEISAMVPVSKAYNLPIISESDSEENELESYVMVEETSKFNIANVEYKPSKTFQSTPEYKSFKARAASEYQSEVVIPIPKRYLKKIHVSIDESNTVVVKLSEKLISKLNKLNKSNKPLPKKFEIHLSSEIKPFKTTSDQKQKVAIGIQQKKGQFPFMNQKAVLVVATQLKVLKVGLVSVTIYSNAHGNICKNKSDLSYACKKTFNRNKPILQKMLAQSTNSKIIPGEKLQVLPSVQRPLSKVSTKVSEEKKPKPILSMDLKDTLITNWESTSNSTRVLGISLKCFKPLPDTKVKLYDIRGPLKMCKINNIYQH